MPQLHELTPVQRQRYTDYKEKKSAEGDGGSAYIQMLKDHLGVHLMRCAADGFDEHMLDSLETRFVDFKVLQLQQKLAGRDVKGPSIETLIAAFHERFSMTLINYEIPDLNEDEDSDSESDENNIPDDREILSYDRQGVLRNQRGEVSNHVDPLDAFLDEYLPVPPHLQSMPGEDWVNVDLRKFKRLERDFHVLRPNKNPVFGRQEFEELFLPGLKAHVDTYRFVADVNQVDNPERHVETSLTRDLFLNLSIKIVDLAKFEEFIDETYHGKPRRMAFFKEKVLAPLRRGNMPYTDIRFLSYLIKNVGGGSKLAAQVHRELPETFDSYRLKKKMDTATALRGIKALCADHDQHFEKLPAEEWHKVNRQTQPLRFAASLFHLYRTRVMKRTPRPRQD